MIGSGVALVGLQQKYLQTLAAVVAGCAAPTNTTRVATFVGDWRLRPTKPHVTPESWCERDCLINCDPEKPQLPRSRSASDPCMFAPNCWRPSRAAGRRSAVDRYTGHAPAPPKAPILLSRHTSCARTTPSRGWGVEPVYHLSAEGGDRRGDEFNRRPVVVRTLAFAVQRPGPTKTGTCRIRRPNAVDGVCFRLTS
jgi:hypothetical protein